MARKLLIPLSAAIAGALITAAPAAAVTVTSCDGLQAALDTDSESTVTLAEGLDCTGSWDLPSGRPITLEGAGNGATLRGDGESRILAGYEHDTVVIRNLTFTGGDTGGSGGAIYLTGSAPVTIADSTFTGNRAGADGGAVRIGEPYRYLARSGARTARGEDGSDWVTITGNTFGGAAEAGNESSDSGGALAVYVPGDVTLAGNEFRNNRGTYSGGGADVAFCGVATVTENTFEDNAVGVRFQEGRAVSGGYGGVAVGGGLALSGSGCFWGEFPSERRDKQEVAFENTVEQAGNAFRSNDLETGEEGDGLGGGEIVGYAAVSSTNDTYHANTMSPGTIGAGGGLMVTYGSAALRNVVATANTMSTGRGGGVGFDSYEGVLSIVHGTIAGNAIGEGEGAGIHGSGSGSLMLENSIVYANTGGPEISGFAPYGDDRSAVGTRPQGGIEVAYTDACVEDGEPYAGDGNICADPKLAGVAAGDVHQTAASPTLDRALEARSGGLEQDYEGQGRFLDYDRSGTAQPDMGADEAPAPEPPAPPQQQPQPQPQQPAPAAGGVLGTQAKSCSSRRSFRIRLRNRGRKVVKATVIVNGKRVKVLRGKRLTSRVNLRGLPKGRFSVRIRLELADGETISGVRRYYTCRPGRKSGPPKV